MVHCADWRGGDRRQLLERGETLSLSINCASADAPPWARTQDFSTESRAQSVQDHAILYLTSGATGEPKMALVTHQAIISNLDMAPDGSGSDAPTTSR